MHKPIFVAALAAIGLVACTSAPTDARADLVDLEGNAHAMDAPFREGDTAKVTVEGQALTAKFDGRTLLISYAGETLALDAPSPGQIHARFDDSAHGEKSQSTFASSTNLTAQVALDRARGKVGSDAGARYGVLLPAAARAITALDPTRAAGADHLLAAWTAALTAAGVATTASGVAPRMVEVELSEADGCPQSCSVSNAGGRCEVSCAGFCAVCNGDTEPPLCKCK